VFGGQTIKTTFCLIDVIKLDGNTNSPERRFEITGAPKDKIYYLVSTSNPDQAFIETNYGNNMAWTSFRLTRDSKGNAKITEVAAAPCTGKLCGVQIPNR
jgi:hypothetical protein